ncbi:hypothetical protein HC026_03180 [Lactobacillus sp. LC28-10]|uniref:Uncharacterized protein n=1 Tax=Secundilactobacillus angelensis TaxID=2722706 RepID=A0ABX1KVH0_9LACO|nr:hypothetical protein [Secundilactobacillus angelensis]MCH5461627.1 hypothetical protein [Secundilactobacillus angelensis]NLR17922.1 hypothetical protein [Secundilactobacillus angelensis]
MKRWLLTAAITIGSFAITGVAANASSYGTTAKSVRGTWYWTTGHYQGKSAGQEVNFTTHKLFWGSFPVGTGNFGYLPKISKVHGWYRINIGTAEKLAKNKNQAIHGWSKSDYMYFRKTTHKVNGKTQSVLLWNVTGSKLKSAMIMTHHKTYLHKGQQTVSVKADGSYHY